MIKIISTQDRVFMAVVGPSGCGKTELLFKMRSGNTFFPKFNKIFFDTEESNKFYNDKKLVKLATAGRHKNINVDYRKHNLYQQNKWSRTIELNATHTILFKSARDIQQVELLGKQLNLVIFLKHCYQLATKETVWAFAY